MSRLLKADIYMALKSKLTMIALILAVAFPVITVLLYVGLRALVGLEGDAADADMMFNANSIISSVYSLTNNIGLVVPAFAGIIACSDYSNGTLRNKVIAGNRRADIYLSHLIVSILFSVVIITVYALTTAGFSLIFFPFKTEPTVDMGFIAMTPLGTDATFDIGKEILYFILNGTMTFVFVATVSTLFAMTFRNIAPTLIFTIVFSIAISGICSIVMLTDYEKYKYLVYFIPTFAGNFFNLGSTGLAALLSGVAGGSKDIMFTEGMLSYLFFGAVHTALGLFIFNKRDIK